MKHATTSRVLIGGLADDILKGLTDVGETHTFPSGRVRTRIPVNRSAVVEGFADSVDEARQAAAREAAIAARVLSGMVG